METFVIVLIVIVSALLGLIILVQNPKGGGLATGFTGANQIGGVKRTTDFLEKATWTLAILLLVLSITATGLNKSQTVTDEGLQDLIEDTNTNIATPMEDNSTPAAEDINDEGQN
jgi:preprotein translocase subunit SecG